MYDWLISPQWHEKYYIANAQGAAVIRHDLHHLRSAQSGIHAGAGISGEEHGLEIIPVIIGKNEIIPFIRVRLKLFWVHVH
jgi:hypothetical protein